VHVCRAGSTDISITASTVAHSISHAAVHVSVDLTAARSLELTESHHTASHNTVNLFCMQSLCMHCMCILVQSMWTEQAGIRMLLLLLHIWGIPGSNFSMETSCLETSYLDGCQHQHVTSNEVVTTCFLILSNSFIHYVHSEHSIVTSCQLMLWSGLLLPTQNKQMCVCVEHMHNLYTGCNFVKF